MGAMGVCGQTWPRINGEEKYKAIVVAKGYSHIPNVDYIAVQNNLVVHQMDVKTGYLNAQT